MSTSGSRSSAQHDDIKSFAQDLEKAQEPSSRTESTEIDQSTADEFLVSLEPEDDPKNMPKWRKWWIVFVVSSGAFCTACSAAMASFPEEGISRDMHVSQEVTILGISVSVFGLSIGPLLVGPMSEVHGRNLIYRLSYLFFFAFTWPTAFPPNIGTYIAFRFLTGFASAAFVSVSGGSVSDLFDNSQVGLPMAVYTLAPFLGPAVGPCISSFINQHANWRWTFRTLLIWIFIELLMIFTVPETYIPTILQRKAKQLRKKTGDTRYWAPLDRQQRNMLLAIALSCYIPFKLMVLDRMALLLNIWAAIILGIQYLTVQAFPIIFQQKHGFNMQETGLTFLGMALGMLIALACQPWFIHQLQVQTIKHNGNPPPEARLLNGKFGAVLLPLSLYWIAFTTYSNVHWIVPIIASVPLGISILCCFTSIFTFLVTAYRPIAASAMASNGFSRGCSGAAFPLFARQMYIRMGTVGATAMLAGIATAAAPLPFIFHRYGARLREKSRFTVR